MATSAVAFRRSTAITLAALVMMLALISVAAWAPYLLILMVVPLAVAVWAWRSGTDADTDGLTVTALLGRRRIPWIEIAGFTSTPRGRVAARLTNGTEIDLPAVSADDLPRLVEASGAPIVTDPR